MSKSTSYPYSTPGGRFYLWCPWLSSLSFYYWPRTSFLNNLRDRSAFYSAYYKCLTGDGSDVFSGPFNCAQIIDGEAYLYWIQAFNQGEIPVSSKLSIDDVKHQFSLSNPLQDPFKYVVDAKLVNPDSFSLM